MDWGRAKSVLIFSFLMLNILLGYQLWMDMRTQLNANVNSAELPQDKIQLMQQKRITLATSLSPDTPRLGDLTYLLEAANSHDTEPTMLKTPVDSAIFFTKSALVDAIGDEVPDLEQYAHDLNSSTDSVFVLHRMVEGRPMFNAKLELYVSNLKIIGYRQDRVELVGMGEEKQALPAAKVVASLIETYVEQGAVITDIQLGYHGPIFDSEKQVAAPSWRVMLEDGTTYYVHAVSGEVATDGSEDDGEEMSASLEN